MRVDALDYQLPAELVALHPPASRDGGRLLLLPAAGSLGHVAIADLDRFLAPGSLMVLNDTRVLPARLLGKKVGSGGRVELLLVRRTSGADGGAFAPSSSAPGGGQRWQALGRASKPLRDGARLHFTEGDVTLEARVVGERGEGGALEVELSAPAGATVDEALARVGKMPLPPYIRAGRRDAHGDAAEDAPEDGERYQTVFAAHPGAVAAPTAGLHLSSALLERLAARGVEVAFVTLHVGLGTFQPVSAEDLDDHPMHAEAFAVPAETVTAVAAARARGAPVVAVGTTVVRALESSADEAGALGARAGETRLLIQPGYRFRVVDRLLTNFHLPRSTLLALVAAFAGRARVLAAYDAAIAAGYRFYSYGDAMLVDRTAPSWEAG
ncbi:MAG: tRNA preQ1(34) S-adenosylmethionine ribosyltransferase-isomerase QueA [Polyangiaceae bacterium]